MPEFTYLPAAGRGPNDLTTRLSVACQDAMATLELKWRHRPGLGRGAPSGIATERWHLDFLVDGRSLYDLLKVDQRDLVGVLGWGGMEANRAARHQLLGSVPAAADSGRRPIFVCPECGGLGCGAITVQVQHPGGNVEWRDFAYENNYDGSMADTTAFASVGPFRFAADAYRRALETAPIERGAQA